MLNEEENGVRAQSGSHREANQIVGLQLRFRESLRRELEDAASSSGHSMNAEIVERLTRSLADDLLLGRGPTRALMIELAAQITHAEAATGEPWHDDPATYVAARELASDVWSRSKPRQENFEQTKDVQAKLLAFRKARCAILDDLKRYRAVEPCERDDLVGTMPADRPYRRSPESSWRDPQDADLPATDMVCALVKLDFHELGEIDREIDETQAELDALMGGWRSAEAEGRAIYVRLTEPRTTIAESKGAPPSGASV